MSDAKKNQDVQAEKNPKFDEAEQRNNAIKLIVFVFVIPLVVVGISLATR